MGDPQVRQITGTLRVVELDSGQRLTVSEVAQFDRVDLADVAEVVGRLRLPSPTPAAPQTTWALVTDEGGRLRTAGFDTDQPPTVDSPICMTRDNTTVRFTVCERGGEIAGFNNAGVLWWVSEFEGRGLWLRDDITARCGRDDHGKCPPYRADGWVTQSNVHAQVAAERARVAARAAVAERITAAEVVVLAGGVGW